jgi:iron complex transport system permease protein
MGVDVAYLKKKIVFASAVGVGAAGIIGGDDRLYWVGGAASGAFLFGVTHRTLMYGSAIVGASLLMLADTVARIAIPPAEIPVSLITSAIGAPVFSLVNCSRSGAMALEAVDISLAIGGKPILSQVSLAAADGLHYCAGGS